MRIAYNSAMTAFAPPAPGQLTPSEEARLPGLIAGVLAAESPREEMLLKNHQGDEGHDRCVLFYP